MQSSNSKHASLSAFYSSDEKTRFNHCYYPDAGSHLQKPWDGTSAMEETQVAVVLQQLPEFWLTQADHASCSAETSVQPQTSHSTFKAVTENIILFNRKV